MNRARPRKGRGTLKQNAFVKALGLLALGSLMFASSASASLYVKNNTNKTIWYTHTYHHSCANGCAIYHDLADGWRNIGWYKIDPGKKVKVKSGSEKRWIYWYAYQVNGGEYSSSSFVWEVPFAKHDNCDEPCINCKVSHPGPGNHHCHSADDHRGHRETWKSADNFTINLN